MKMFGNVEENDYLCCGDNSEGEDRASAHIQA